MAFFQSPPELGNQYTDDRVLRSYLARVLPPEVRRAIEPTLDAMGALAGGELYALQRADRLHEPVLTQWDAWGQRVNHIEVSPLWERAARVAAEHGVVATAYERAHGPHSRVHQMALMYLFNPSTDVYSCPLAMTDGAARTLLAHRNLALIERALPRLTSRDPSHAWTSGQWMTERGGGSDVSNTETLARPEDGAWRLYGTKWFSSATTSQMALTLARPETPGGGGTTVPGSRGLALFYVETRDPTGGLNGIRINRLKDKLGTRKVPTAELSLEGALAIPVAGLGDGVRSITPMLNITRTWNAVCAASGMRRALALCRDYARRRVAFGAPLADKPLHADTLAGLQAESEAALHLSFRAVELIGLDETGRISDREADLLRLVTPLAKLTTAKQAVAVSSEALEAFGGAGYVEDTGLPALLRDAQVLPIWEGTTNVLALDVLRVMARGDALAALAAEVDELTREARDGRLVKAGERAREALAHATGWLGATRSDLPSLEAGARRLALTLGRALELALLVRHGQWSLDHERDGRAAAAAARFARHGVDLLVDVPGGPGGPGADALRESAALAGDPHRVGLPGHSMANAHLVGGGAGC